MHLIRRSFLGGLIAAFAAPAIVRASSLMPIQPLLVPENAIVQVRTRVLGPPRCSICFGPFGMCEHTGGPLDLKSGDPRLDEIVERLMYEPQRLRESAKVKMAFASPGGTLNARHI
jgi:hypothetical protein